MSDICQQCGHRYCVECDPTCPRCGAYNGVATECKCKCKCEGDQTSGRS